MNTEQNLALSKARSRIGEYDKKLITLSTKQITQIQYFEQQNKFVNMGKKVYELIKKFKKHKTNKALNEAVEKIVGIERAKVLTLDQPVVFNENLKAPKLTEVKIEMEQVKKMEKEVIFVQEVVAKKPIKIGDKVRMKNQTKPGEVLEIKGKKVSVIIGNFTFNTTLKEVEHF